jgi:hypothetical protein
MQSGLFVGCTQLDDGTPVLVLDVAAIGYGAGIPRELHRPSTIAAHCRAAHRARRPARDPVPRARRRAPRRSR